MSDETQNSDVTKEFDMAAAVPEVWVVTSTSDDGPFQVKAAGPFDS